MLIPWPGSNGNIRERIFGLRIGDSSFHYRRQNRRACLTDHPVGGLPPAQSSESPGASGWRLGFAPGRLIRPSIYSQSSRDDSDAWPHLGITDGAQESGCSWRLGSLPRETAASGTSVGPKLFSCFISFLFRNRVPFFQVKISKSIAFSPLGKCVWSSLQQVSSWRLRPPC